MMDFDAFWADIKQNGWNVFGAEAYEDGALVDARGDTEENLHEIYSVTKSVLSVAAGIAWDRGLIDLNRSLLAYLPGDRVEKLPPPQKAALEQITLHRLLTMSVPEWPFVPEGESWLDFCLHVPLTRPRERAFNYSNINAYLLGVALTAALGEDVGAFIESQIFAPLGIARFSYARCPEGYFYGASGMRLTVRDLSKIGLMLCAGGVWEGKRIVSEDYILKATAAQQSCREGGYGYFFWKDAFGFSLHGKWKQRCYVVPEKQMVIAWLAHVEDPSPALQHCMERRLLGLSTEHRAQ